MNTTPTLNPFADAEEKPASNWMPIIAAIILGIATSAGVLMWRLPSITASSSPASSQAPSTIRTKITSQSKDWDFYTTEIDNLVNELKTEREKYQKKAKDFDAVELRIATEKKELIRIREEIEKMRAELTGRRKKQCAQPLSYLLEYEAHSGGRYHLRNDRCQYRQNPRPHEAGYPSQNPCGNGQDPRSHDYSWLGKCYASSESRQVE